MTIEVLTSCWHADGEAFESGVHEISAPSADFLRLVAGAEAAGVITVKASKSERKGLDAHVEPDDDSLAARAAAQKETGVWYEGNALQFNLDVEQGLREGEPVDVDEYCIARRGVSDG